MKRVFSRYPVYFLLLPVFFVWHGYVEFYDLMSISKSILLVGRYMLGALIVAGLSWLMFRNTRKAALYAFLVMCIYFFFGSWQDWTEAKFNGSIITRYTFIFPAIILLIILMFIYVKKRKTELPRTTAYLNLLMIILLVTDAILLTNKAGKSFLAAGHATPLQSCKDCPKPDVYFLLADGYSGHIPLKRFFNYDNSDFESQLRNREFFVNDSSLSNYNYTVFSLGSTFNMDYLNTHRFYEGKEDLPKAFKSLRENRVLRFFSNQGYEIVNYSIFDLEKKPAVIKKALIELIKDPLTTQTFTSRVRKDLGYHFAKLGLIRRKKRVNDIWSHMINNNIIDSLTKKQALTAAPAPRFIYSHLVMPHWPYYFDSTGTIQAESSLNDHQYRNKDIYISYLKYCNKKLLELVDTIQKNNSRPAIIVLVSDHGCRECLQTKEELPYQNVNFSAVYLPGNNYSGFYHGISNVNLFRVILNNAFNQKLSLLKDSTILINPVF